MPYLVSGIEWTPLDVSNYKRRGGNHKDERVVKLVTKKHKDTGKEMVTHLTVSYALGKDAGWKAGTKVRLFKSGKMFMLKPEKSSLTIPIRQPNRRTEGENRASFIVGGVEIARAVHSAVYQATKREDIYVFEAWVDGDAVIFKPAEE